MLRQPSSLFPRGAEETQACAPAESPCEPSVHGWCRSRQDSCLRVRGAGDHSHSAVLLVRLLLLLAQKFRGSADGPWRSNSVNSSDNMSTISLHCACLRLWCPCLHPARDFPSVRAHSLPPSAESTRRWTLSSSFASQPAVLQSQQLWQHPGRDRHLLSMPTTFWSAPDSPAE